MIQSKAAIADGKGHFSMGTIEIDKPQGDEVLIQIKAAGVCHTDWDSQSWGKPLVMGHEGAGIVKKIGKGVKSLKQASDKSPIFIAGLSMGGFGALRLGAKYPSVFKAFSGLSSITHFTQIGEFVSDFDNLKQHATEQDGVLDCLLKNKNNLSPFRFDCGKNDVLIGHNRQLHADLLKLEIPHTYQEFEGEHSWGYWEKHLEETLLFFALIT